MMEHDDTCIFFYAVQFYDEYDFDILGELLFILCWHERVVRKLWELLFILCYLVSSSFFAFLLAH